MQEILIAGGGPAGAAAAIAARLEGSPVRLIDRATTFRHKVCGEFISPGACELLEAFEVSHDVGVLRPRRIQRCLIHVGHRTKQWKLAEPAWGLSRLELDRVLIERATALGAIVSRGQCFDARRNDLDTRVILACGRKPEAEPGDRLFGFKTHFEGPADDAIELFFNGDAYVGVGCIENGMTNVCGLARESLLRKYAFDFDEIIQRYEPLVERLRPLQRRMRWIVTGPLSFTTPARHSGTGIYPAGDALGFVDPFTGSGILNALLTGRLAGIAAARRVSPSAYVRACKAVLGNAFFASSVIRCLLGCQELHWLVPYLPGQMLFRLTRAMSVGTYANIGCRQ